MNMKIINVAKDFSKFPSGRKKLNNDYSGEEFSERFLIPYLKNTQPITIELDGVIGYSSAFLMEAFTNAIKRTNISYEQFRSLVVLKSSNEILLKEISLCINKCYDKNL